MPIVIHATHVKRQTGADIVLVFTKPQMCRKF